MKKNQIENIHISSLIPIISPSEIHQNLSLSEKQESFILSSRQEIVDIIQGRDNRLLVISGPCSIHDSEAANEYAERLALLRKKFSKNLCILMRVYFEKPRTTIGWKGLINDPDLNNSFNITKGLNLARTLLLSITEKELPLATEFLDVFIPQYIGDLISWGAIGARTVESQIHRQLASGLSMPIGFKNATNGDIQVAVQACIAAKKEHHFLSITKEGRGSIAATTGNPNCHIILRGGKIPNYERKDVEIASSLLKEGSVISRVMIDCSHNNSNKDPQKQKEVAGNITRQIESGNEDIFAVMLESHLKEGAQSLENCSKLIYGKSITDACMSWGNTEEIIERLAEAMEKRN